LYVLALGPTSQRYIPVRTSGDNENSRITSYVSHVVGWNEAIGCSTVVFAGMCATCVWKGLYV